MAPPEIKKKAPSNPEQEPSLVEFYQTISNQLETIYTLLKAHPGMAYKSAGHREYQENELTLRRNNGDDYLFVDTKRHSRQIGDIFTQQLHMHIDDAWIVIDLKKQEGEIALESTIDLNTPQSSLGRSVHKVAINYQDENIVQMKQHAHDTKPDHLTDLLDYLDRAVNGIQESHILTEELYASGLHDD